MSTRSSPPSLAMFHACYLALGVTCDGEREVLGIWWQDIEGAKFRQAREEWQPLRKV